MILHHICITGLYELFSTKFKQGFYPSLIYLFFTNLTYKDDDNSELFSTIVKETEIELSSRSLGKIFHISYRGLTPILMDDEEVLSRIYLLGQGPPMANNKLTPIPRLIGYFHAYNICPKMESFNYSRDVVACVYVIMAKLEVNWAKILVDNTSHLFPMEHISLFQEVQS